LDGDILIKIHECSYLIAILPIQIIQVMKLHYSFLILSLFILSACKKECPKTEDPEVTCTINLDKGLMAYYPFNGNFNDESGNGNHGVAMNGAYLTTDFLGRQNKAAGFDGVNDYIIVTDNGKLNSDSITVSLRLFVNNTNRRQTFVNRVDFSSGAASSYGLGQSLATTNQFDFSVSNSSQDCSAIHVYDPSGIVSSPETMQAGRWYHMLTTFGNGEQRLYIDGVLKATKSTSFKTLKKCSASKLVIGGWLNSDIISIDGKLDEIRLYNRVLSDCEINELTSTFKSN
jgi:hypothetical protein